MGGAFLVKKLGEYDLFDFTNATFTVSRSITDSPSSEEHRFGPTESEVLNYLSSENYTWANQFVDVPIAGYQRWTVPKNGIYSFEIKGGNAGATDQNSRGRACVVTADFNLNKNDKLLLCVGQGVPDYIGDHCNGGGGATWVALGDNYETAIPLLVANGGPGDTSDGSSKKQPNTSFNRNVDVSGVTGIETTPIVSNANIGNGGTLTTGFNDVASGGWLTSGGSNFSGGEGAGFKQGLLGGLRNNSTAGNGGFGGGSGGHDEGGNASGGFTGATGQDNGSETGVGSSFVNDLNVGNVSCRLSATTTTYQSSDFKGENQYHGYVTITRL